MFEGAIDHPVPDRWADLIDKYKITIFYTAPTAIRMFAKYGKKELKGDSFKSLRLIASVGEPIDEDAWRWYFKEVGHENCPLLDTWWQTETGGILITSLPGIGPFRPSFTGRPFPGLKFEIVDDKGKPVGVNEPGTLVLKPPFAPSLLRGIYNNPQKYLDTYWSQYGDKIYFTSDAAMWDENGLIRITGRMDDVIKVAGHRLSTGELEAAINAHPDIVECAVIGVPDPIKGEVPVAFVTLEKGKNAEVITKATMDQVRTKIGPIASLSRVIIVDDLPKTRSGKIMRRILKNLWNKEELGDLSTLANPESVDSIRKLLGTAPS
jgi:acetyl-CoA synthetase